MPKPKETILRGDTVKLRSVKGTFTLSTGLPTGKALVMDFNEKNEYVADVPTEVLYFDDFGEEHLFHRNFAQQLLDSYNKKDSYNEVVDRHFEVVEVVKAQTIEAPTVKDSPTSKRKAKKNEEVS